MLGRLEELEFIYATGQGEQGGEYSFKHVLTQQAVYEALLRGKREALHERVGRAVETVHGDQLEAFAEVLAYHYGRSANADKAVEYLDRANQKASRLNAMVEAKAHFVEAMRLLDALPDTEANRRRRVALLVNQILVFLRLFQLGEYYADLTRFEPVAAGLGDPSLLGAYHGSMAWCEWGLGRFQQAIDTATRAAELCEAAENAEGAAHAYMVLAVELLHHWRVRAGPGPRVSRRARAGSAGSNFSFVHVFVELRCRWPARGLADSQRAAEFAEKMLRIAEEFADRSMTSFALWVMASRYFFQEDSRRAFEAAERSVDVAPTPADRSWAEATLATGPLPRGQCRAGRGDPRTAPAGVPGGPLHSERRLHPYLGEAYWRAGEYDKGRAVLEELLAIIEPCGMRAAAAVAHRILGEIAAKTDPARAARYFDRSIAVLSEIKAEPELALGLRGLRSVPQTAGPDRRGPRLPDSSARDLRAPRHARRTRHGQARVGRATTSMNASKRPRRCFQRRPSDPSARWSSARRSQNCMSSSRNIVIAVLIDSAARSSLSMRR